MKRQIFVFCAAVLMLAGCKGTSETTTLTGIFGEDVPEAVEVKVAGLDTLVKVENGTFSVSVPTDVTVAGDVRFGKNLLVFIPDGTLLTADFSSNPQKVLSSSKKSLTEQVQDLREWGKALSEDYRKAVEAIAADASLSDEQKEEKRSELSDKTGDEYFQHHKAIFDANSGNYLGYYALREVYGYYSQDELLEAFDKLPENLQKERFVTRMRESIASQAKTKEGMMFTDFEVEYDGKTTKLSDYVGKGKYVLVDFWASWCGPCKREIPNLKSVYEKYHGDNFDLLSVAVWDKPQASIDTAAAYSIPWNHMVNAQTIPTDLYGISGIPHIILFGPDGTIIKRDLRGEAIGEEVGKYVK